MLPRRQPQALPKLVSIPLKRGAERAFEQLYKKHARDVYQYALAVLTNPADAEDVTQQTFLNAYRALERGERPLRPHNWLITIAHNVCRMRWRQASHRPKEVALDDVPEPVAPVHDQPSLDEVLRALARLSFNQRAALVMRELEGRSYREIAGVLGVSVGAVEALLFRGRRHLRLQRQALGVLGTAPLPTSLASSLGLGGAGAGGGAVAAGGTALGSDLVLKAAALVAVGAMTAGVGYRVIHPARTPAQPAAAAQAPAQTHARAAHKGAGLASPAHRKRQANTRGHKPARRARAVQATRRSIQPSTTAPAPPQLPQPIAAPAAPIPVQTPQLPVQAPAVPNPPVQAPSLPIPPLPPLPPLLK